MNNKKKIIILTSITIVIIGIIICVLFITKKEEPKPPVPPAPQPVKKHETEILNDIAIEFYNNEDYLNFPLMNGNVYFASRTVLKDFGYDDSIIDATCNDTTPIIYFDVNYVLNDSYDGEPIVFRTKCDVTYK